VQEFWRRWHISLSTWFRDYLYLPLGGNRVSTARMYGNLITVFFLCGLWHGASWNFVIWGLWHGTFLVVERVTGMPQRGARSEAKHAFSSASSASSAVRHIYTLLVVIVGWVFFRADTLGTAIAFLGAMAGLSPAAPTPYTVQWFLTSEVWLALAAGVIGSTPWLPALAARIGVRSAEESTVPTTLQAAASLFATASLLAVLVASIMQMAARTYNPFIYFRF
jgi:alginate O-acetyltransferase complex protein AlgI